MRFIQEDLREAVASLPSLDGLDLGVQMLGAAFSRTNRVLCVLMHPDDLTLAAFVLAFYFRHVSLVTMSRRTGDADRTLPAVAEAIAARVCRLWVGDESDGRGPEYSRENEVKLFKIMQKEKPAIVVTHSPRDNHPAHQAVSRLVQAVVRMVAPWNKPVVWSARPPSMLYLAEWMPDVFFQLSPDLAKLKVTAIRLHPSEAHKRFYCEEDHLRLLGTLARVADPYGERSDLLYVEGFARVNPREVA